MIARRKTYEDGEIAPEPGDGSAVRDALLLANRDAGMALVALAQRTWPTIAVSEEVLLDALLQRARTEGGTWIRTFSDACKPPIFFWLSAFPPAIRARLKRS